MAGIGKPRRRVNVEPIEEPRRREKPNSTPPAKAPKRREKVPA